MFYIKLAKIPIGIENKYSYIRDICKEFEVPKMDVLFTVYATEEEVLEQQEGDIRFSKGYCESLCIFRKICYEIIKYDAFLMHSAVIEMDGVAYVFAAPSGVGKTTHIVRWLEQFWGKAQVLNGDKPIFRFIDEKLYACGTPWKGKEGLGCNIICPVQAICFIEQSQENKIHPLSLPEISRRIFRQILLPAKEEDFEHFWLLVERMITTVDFYLLQCNQELEAAQIAYDVMRRK